MSNKSRLKESEITASIRAFLKTMKIFHWKNFGGPMGTPGVPDILGIYGGRFMGIEVKTFNGKLSDEQRAFIDRINAEGGIGFVARSIDDVIEHLGLQDKVLIQ
jgi:hypothetical protein